MAGGTEICSTLSATWTKYRPLRLFPAPSACLQPERILLGGSKPVLDDFFATPFEGRPGSIGGRARVRKACAFFRPQPLPSYSSSRRVQPLQSFRRTADFRRQVSIDREQSCTTRSQLSMVLRIACSIFLAIARHSNHPRKVQGELPRPTRFAWAQAWCWSLPVRFEALAF